MRVWKLKKDRRRSAADLYSNSRPARSCKQIRQQSAAPSSGPSTLPSTIPDSQNSCGSESTLLRTSSTQLSRGDELSQRTSQSGSIFFPDSSGVTSQSSEVISSQSQHLLTQSTTSASNLDSQISFITGSNTSSSWLGSHSTLSRVIGPFSQSSTQSFSSTLRQSNSHPTTSSKSNRSEASFSQFATPYIQHTKRQVLGTSSCLSHDATTIVEVQETPPSRLAVENTPSTEHSNSQINLPDSQNVPSSAYKGNSRYFHRVPIPGNYRHIRQLTCVSAFRTPFCQPQRPHISATLSIPETVYSNCSRSASKRRLLRQHSNPEGSPSVVIEPSLRRRSSWSQGTPIQDIPELEIWDSLSSLELTQGLISQFEDTIGDLGAMDNSPSNNNGSANHPGVAPAVGGSLRDRLNRLRNKERAAVQPLQTLSGSETPSSAGDIEPTVRPAHPQTVNPLSVRVDTEPHAHHEARPEPAQAHPVACIAPQALHYNAEHAVVAPQFIQESEVNLTEPSGLGLPIPSQEEVEDIVGHTAINSETLMPLEVGGPGLGPLEFAIPLPMDSRVKDDYVRILDSEEGLTNYLGKSHHDASSGSEVCIL